MILIKYFTSPSCGPCKMFSPIVETVSHEMNISIQKIDATMHRELASEYQIGSVPTLVIVKDGTPVARHTGVMAKGQLEQFIKAHS